MYTGLFFSSFALFYFEVICTQLLGFVLGPAYIFVVVSIAMLGITAAGSLLSVVNSRFQKESLSKWGFFLSGGMGILFLFSLLFIAYVKSKINLSLDAPAPLLADAPFWYIHEVTTQEFTPWVGLILLFPYLAFGFLVTLIFRSSSREEFHKLYAVDLIGGAGGAIAAWAATERLPYTVVVLIPVLFSFVAALAYIFKKTKTTYFAAALAIFVCITSLGYIYRHSLEPKAHAALVTRQGRKSTRTSQELWSGWTTYARVGMFAGDGIPKHLVLGNGEGHASLTQYVPNSSESKFEPAQLAGALGTPSNILVLFAGVGHDMIHLNARMKGESDITGVELNPKLIEASRLLPELRLEEFFHQPNIHYIVDEARSFLEKDKKLYNVILLSWTGATAAYHTGAVGATTQFVYTVEGFRNIFRHLAPGGFVIVLNANKLRVLATARKALESLSKENIQNAFAVYGSPEAASKGTSLALWEQFRVIIKPEGLTKTEVDAFSSANPNEPYEVLYAPNQPSKRNFKAYFDILHTSNLETYLSELSRMKEKNFSVATDDKTFILNEIPANKYLNFENLKAGFVLEEPLVPIFLYRTRWILFIIIGALALVLFPMLFVKNEPNDFTKSNAMRWRFLLYFFSLGIGYMLIEIGVMHKAVLVLGNPGFAISVVLAGAVAFTGIGSLMAQRFQTVFNRRALNISTFSLFAYSLLLFFFWDKIFSLVLGLSVWFRILSVLAALAPLFSILGLFFPIGLTYCENYKTNLVSWAWAINGAFGAIAAAVAPILATSIGFHYLILTGVGFYFFTFLIPREVEELSYKNPSPKLEVLSPSFTQ